VDFLPQLHRAPALREEQFSSGVFRILVGLAKKIVIADFLAVKLVDPVFAAPGAAAGVEVLLAVYAYALQIYCDFSGYSDIAVGCGRLLGFDIVENFAAPYKARSVAEFWSRWHISLSTWFRDYLFLPLAYRVTRRLGRCADDPRRAQLWAYALTTLVVMLLVGLWHGAAWTFVAWGALHGIALALGRAGATARRQRSRGSALVAGIGTFHFICLGWVLFRSGTFATAAEVCAALTRAQPLRLVGGGVLAVMAIGFVTLLWPESGKASVEQRFVRAPTWVQALVVVLGLAVFQAMAQTAHPFIYFQF
jgi:D-alanyl-lipoteichoic acid acyltransferase DltB (MBOAT superfamily)